MSVNGEKFMRMMVFFDLPASTKTERGNAARFRTGLLNDGYYMMQWSVYSRICKGLANVAKHSQRLKCMLPPRGSIRLLVVTEKQFADMEILVGGQKKWRKLVTNNCFCSDLFVKKTKKASLNQRLNFMIIIS